jgi:dTDP-4-amino-4,6-dideoxygalactose transaminase
MTGRDGIPFLDLVTPHRELGEELVSVFRSALASAGFIGGPMVEEFEAEFARFCGAQHCVGVGSGTDALRFALIAAGIRPGDTVLTAPNTFIATAEAIAQAGARPDFVDVDERTYNLDPRQLYRYIQAQCFTDSATGRLVNRRTGSPITGIVPVHLYGQMADMDPILELAEQHRLVVVEDACQAHGATYFSRRQNGWKHAGSLGRAAAFSFYPGKNLGACGEAGAVTTHDNEVAHKIRMLRDHGQVRKYSHEMEGYNGRLDAIQAGILLAKLKHLPAWNAKRRCVAEHYKELFQPYAESVVTPSVSSQATSVYHLYVIRVRHRDQLQAHLGKAHIATAIHYPTPLHLLKPYAHLGHKEGDFPVAEKLAGEILSLPMFPHLDQRLVERVVDTVVESLQASPVRTPVAAARPLAAFEPQVVQTAFNS